MSQSTIAHGVFLLLAAILAGAPSAAAASPCKQGLVTDKGVPVAPGIVLRKQQCDDPLYRAFVVEIDLETKGLGFFVTPYNKKRAATSKFAASNNARKSMTSATLSITWPLSIHRRAQETMHFSAHIQLSLNFSFTPLLTWPAPSIELVRGQR